MKKIKKRAILNGLGIIVVLGATTGLVVLDILNSAAFILAAVVCCPMARYLWQFACLRHRNTISVLRKMLPKAGFSIENTEWNDQHSLVRFHGKFRDEKFLIEASKDTTFIMVCNLPWAQVRFSDPIVPKIMEAINEVNSNTSGMSVVISEPNDKGVRHLYTHSCTILPTFRPDEFLEVLLLDMLKCKPALAEAFEKERPYMTQRRGPVGFNAQQPSD